MSGKAWIPAALITALILARPAAAQGPAAPAGGQPAAESGRLGGGYRDAKWGMSMAEVEKRLAARIEYESRQPSINKTLILDLGQGRKVTCYFEHDQFYQAIYQPVASDGDQQAAEAVMAGLEKKYGPGKEEEGFTDKHDRPLKLITWNDGISKIELQMREPTPPAPAKVAGTKPWVYPSSSLAVIYTGISLNARREQRQQEERMRSEEEQSRKKVQKVQDDL
jgi:hypothetical protein